MQKIQNNSIYWFRKSLRLHDNPSLLYALANTDLVYPIFILDPYFVKTAKVGPNRWRFLLESLSDLNTNLKKKNSSLIILKGEPKTILNEKFKEWSIKLLCYELDTEPYSKLRDFEIDSLANSQNIQIYKTSSHTLYDLDNLFKKNGGKVCLSYTSMLNLINKVGEPNQPKMDNLSIITPHPLVNIKEYSIPSLEEIGIDPNKCGPRIFPGGESEALLRMKNIFKDEDWVSNFEKPKTIPNSLTPSTTVLSPYLKFGCLSPRYFYAELKRIQKKHKKSTQPPVSLLGQLYWREFFYFVGAYSPNFDKIQGNVICRQIQWETNEDFFQKWKNAETGYPFIDAVMTQLKQEGWIHHLARHAVACFLTRGDLYLSWEKGLEVFEEWLIDADWSLNAANWMWLSASCFFYQYWRVYSPVEFGKKTDKNGDYIKKYLPVLKDIPKEFIYEPWEAPDYVQKKAKCIIGVDYPFPIVNHKEKMKENIEKMKKSYSEVSHEEDLMILEKPALKKKKI